MRVTDEDVHILGLTQACWVHMHLAAGASGWRDLTRLPAEWDELRLSLIL